MEQLIQYNPAQSLQTTRGRIIEVAMLRKKVTLQLTQSQFEVLDGLFVLYLHTARLTDHMDKAHYFLVHQVYEKKIRPRHLDLKVIFKLSFNIAEASAIYLMLLKTNIQSCFIYENNLRNFITSEIDHQTA